MAIKGRYITTQLPADIYQKIAKLAFKKGKNMAQIYREAILEYIKQKEQEEK